MLKMNLDFFGREGLKKEEGLDFCAEFEAIEEPTRDYVRIINSDNACSHHTLASYNGASICNHSGEYLVMTGEFLGGGEGKWKPRGECPMSLGK